MKFLNLQNSSWFDETGGWPLPINLHKLIRGQAVTFPQEKIANSPSINFKRAIIRFTKEKC